MRSTPHRGRIAAAPLPAVYQATLRPAPVAASNLAPAPEVVLLAAALLAAFGLAACWAPAPRGGPAAPENAAAPAAGTWIEARDGVSLRVHAWEPAGPIRGLVLMVPGVTGLDTRMEAPVTEPLTAAGFAVFALAPRGTGESGGPRGYAGSASLILDDLARFAAWGRDRAGAPVGTAAASAAAGHSGTAAGLPVFLFGHSMGGTFALAVAADMERSPAGLILINPAYKYLPLRGATPGFGDYLRFAAYWIFAPRKPVVDMGGDPSLLEDPDDREEALERIASPEVQGLQSMASMTAARKIMSAAPRNAARLSAPGLILEGARDLLIDPAGTDEIASAWGGSGAERVRVDGAHGLSSTLSGMEAIIEWLAEKARR